MKRKQPRIGGMMFQTRSGRCWSRICRDDAGSGAELPRIIGDLSTLFSGYYGQARRGAICRQIMADGATPIAALSAGGTRGSGRSS